MITVIINGVSNNTVLNEATYCCASHEVYDKIWQ